ncbi:hypothetical protein A8B79_02455 [Balneola sp. EhC07]|uniref:hypothetical protein n=1 Tax=Balneola sp. EhC07 TaxID=1849360 RepID=UPI0007F3F9C0|nr:hypothetical protein [Balneola sp. EhC07]OAN62432.1 hypothetical protein A8B79_02455 [Balneola sp. EhC07]
MEPIKKEVAPAKVQPLSNRKKSFNKALKIANSNSLFNLYNLGKSIAELENKLMISDEIIRLIVTGLPPNLTYIDIYCFYEAYFKFREVE